MSSDLAVELPDRGVLYVVTGPSGVGKSTLIKRAIARIDGLSFSVSATTRPPRAGEVDGVDYHFLTRQEFDDLLERDAFIEHATVYDRSYGTLRDQVEDALAQGRSILLDIDMVGARQVRARLAHAVLIFLAPPSIAELERRLRSRGTDPDEVIARRMALVAEQTRGCGAFDYIVVNGDLPTAHATFEGVLLAEMARCSRRESWIAKLHAEVDDISRPRET